MWGIHWAGFVPAAVVVSLIPGANQVLSLRNAIRQGTTDASIALAGRFAAFAIMVLVVALGLGAVLTSSPVALTVIRWLGVAYLGWLGLLTLWRSRRTTTSQTTFDEETRSRRVLLRQEFAVAAANPKAYLLFAAFLPQFIADDTYPAALQLIALGVAYIAVEAVTAFLYTVAGGRIRSFDLSDRAKRLLDRLTAASFIGLAVALSFG